MVKEVLLVWLAYFKVTGYGLNVCQGIEMTGKRGAIIRKGVILDRRLGSQIDNTSC